MYKDVTEFTGSYEKCQVYSEVRHRDKLHPTFSPTINFKWMVDIVAMHVGSRRPPMRKRNHTIYYYKRKHLRMGDVKQHNTHT